MFKRSTNPEGKAGLPAWFVFRCLDDVVLYSRVYSAIEGVHSSEKAMAVNDIFKTVLHLLKSSFSWMSSKQVEYIAMDAYDISLLRGKFIILVFFIRRGSSIKYIYKVQEKVLKIIETDAEGRLSSQIDEPELLRDVWMSSEEKIRPFIHHIF
ncbi:MAG: hypothetical protein ACXABU_09625 [Candidatus Hodarchaeales archaeon]|jgi:hypothetical protein